MSNARKLADNLPREGQFGNRNFIINGNFKVWQRNTTAHTANNTYNTVDRFKAYNNIGAYTTERSDDHPHSAGFSLKCQCTTADTSVTAADYAFINHEVEGQNLQHLKYGTSNAKSVTLSFWVKSNKTGTYTASIYKHAGGATAYMWRKEYTINAANTWEKKILTASPTAGSTTVITSSAGKISNGSYGFGVSFCFTMGSNYHGTNDTWENNAKYGTSNQVNWMDSTSNNFYLAEVQMEEGIQATPFQHEDVSTTLYKCQRYFFKHEINSHNGQLVCTIDRGTNYYYTHINFPQPMRGTPTMSETYIDNIHKPGVRYDTITAGPNFYQLSPYGCYINVGGANTDATSYAAMLGATSSNVGAIYADAEL